MLLLVATGLLGFAPNRTCLTLMNVETLPLNGVAETWSGSKSALSNALTFLEEHGRVNFGLTSLGEFLPWCRSHAKIVALDCPWNQVAGGPLHFMILKPAFSRHQ